MSATKFYATGRRKSAIARVWLFQGQKGFLVNGRNLPEYVNRETLQMRAEEPLVLTKLLDQFRVRVTVAGGGLAGQADAISLGISRALVKYDEKLRSVLRGGDLLTRDPREKERKKFGRKGARKRFQYTKR